MVQEIIIEIFSEYLANIGFVITFALIIESAMMHGIIFKFRTRIKVYFITLYLEKVRQLNPTKKEIFDRQQIVFTFADQTRIRERIFLELA